jgi:hypothetical protein
LKVMFHGYTSLLPIFDEDAAVYLSKVKERYWNWRQTIRAFIKGLSERRCASANTHGNSNPERWTFNAPASQWYEMLRLNEHKSYVDLSTHFEVREALMGISLLHYMAGGDKPPAWINEFEGIKYKGESDHQGLHTDSNSRTQIAYPTALPRPTSDRDKPPSATLTSAQCGLKHGDPRSCTPREHALRLYAMQRTFDTGDQGLYHTYPPETTEQWCVWATQLMTNGFHAGQGQVTIRWARFGVFMACQRVPYRQSAYEPDTENTTSAVVFAAGYEAPTSGVDDPDDVASAFSAANPYLEEYPVARVSDNRDVAGDSVLVLKPATTGCFSAQVGTGPKDPAFREAVPNSHVAALSRQSYEVAQARPEAMDSRLVWMDRASIPDERFGRLVCGNLILALDLVRSERTGDESLRTLHVRWAWQEHLLAGASGKSSIMTSIGGDVSKVAVEGTVEGEPILRVPKFAGSEETAYVIHRAGVVAHGLAALSAFKNRTVYMHGPLASLCVEGLGKEVDPSGSLRHRLLFEGCGYQARAVNWNEANTHYVVHWWTDGREEPPTVNLHLWKVIPALGEVTRPRHINVASTVHKNALTGQTIKLNRDESR